MDKAVSMDGRIGGRLSSRHRTRPMLAWFRSPAALALLTLALAATPAPAVQFDFAFDESDGSFSPAQRNVLEYAGDLWSQWLTPTGANHTLSVDVRWNPETSVASASAERTKVTIDGVDVWMTEGAYGHHVGNSEDIGTISFSPGINWYTGTDGLPPSGTADMVSTALHEIGHLMGMVSTYRGDQDWGRLSVVNRYLDHFDTYLRDASGNAPEPGSDIDFDVAEPIWFVGPWAEFYHGGPVRINVPDTDPEEDDYPNIAHPAETGGIMTYGDRTRSRHGLYDYEVGMFQDLRLSFQRPSWMDLTLRFPDEATFAVWHNGANWDWGLPPDADTSVSLHMADAGDDYELRVTKLAEAAQFWMGGADDAEARLRVEDEGILLVDNAYIGAEPDSRAHLHVTGEDAWMQTGALNVGYDGVGALVVDEAGAAYSETAVVGDRVDADATARVHHDDSRWQIDELLTIGRRGEGTLDFHLHAVIEAGQLHVGRHAGSSGTIRGGVGAPSITNARIIVDGPVAIGGSPSEPGGVGHIELVNGASLFSDGPMHVWSDGSLEIRGSDSVVRAASLQIRGGHVEQRLGSLNIGPSTIEDHGLHLGAGGAANLHVADGGLLETSQSNLDASGSDTSMARVTGPGTRWENDGRLDIGILGDATLQVLEHAQVTTGVVRAGQGFGHGQIFVVGDQENPGEPSRLDVDGQMRLGDMGTGQLHVLDGGEARTDWINAGIEDGSYGGIYVRGSGLDPDREPIPARLVIEKDIDLGLQGLGQMFIERGGHVHADELTISARGGQGIAEVHHRDSLLELDRSLAVGAVGRGSLLIADDAAVHVGATTTVGDIDGFGELEIDGGTLHTHSLHFHVGSAGAWAFDRGRVIVDGGSFQLPGQDLRLDGVVGPDAPLLALRDAAEAQLEPGRRLIIGETGHGRLEVSAGSTLLSHGADVGGASAEEFNVVIADAGSALTSTEDIHVAPAGQAAVAAVDGGAIHAQAELILAGSADAAGALVVTGVDDDADRASLLEVAGHAIVGEYGAAALQVDDRARATIDGDLTLAARQPSEASLLLGQYFQGVGGGNGGRLDVAGNLYVASDAGSATPDVGMAQVLIDEHGRLDVAGHAYLGPEQAQDVVAALTLNGGLARMQALHVRADGELELRDGELVIDGGTFEHAHTLQDLHLDGHTSGDRVELTLTNNAVTTNIDHLDVGHTHAASIEVRSGSVLSTGDSRIAAESTAHGHVHVAGTQSAWHASSLYVGGTADAAGGEGTLSLADHAHVHVDEDMIIWDDGTLKGQGTVDADELVSAGTVDPGNSTGTLHITGDYTQQDAGRLEISLGGTDAGQFDQLHVAGSATLAGALDLSLADGFLPTPADSFDILLADQGLAGTFDTVQGSLVDDGPAFSLLYDTQHVELVFDLLPGDMNLDGVVDTADVAPFVQALTDPQAYMSQFGIDEDTMITLGDINDDGGFDTADVAPFVQLLVDGDSPSVPEPGSLALLAMGMMALLRRGRA